MSDPQSIAAPKRRRPLRLKALRLHQWLGAVVCLYMALLMATGTVAVFDREIDRFFASEVAGGAGPVGGFGPAFDRLRAAVPEAQVLRLEREPGYWVALADGAAGKVHVFVDAQTGAVRELSQRVSVQRIVRDIHANLMVPHWLGRLAVTAFGLVLLFQLASGLWSYRRFWRGFFRISGGWGGWHRFAALWSLPILLIAALTSVVFFLEVFGVHPKPLKSGPVSARDAPLPAGFTGADLERLIAQASQSLPRFEAHQIAFPGTRKAALEVQGTTGALLAKDEATMVVFDPATGASLGQRNALEASALVRISAASVPLHYGDFGGTLSKTIWAIGGILGTILCLTGAKVAAQRGGMGTIWIGVPLLGRLGLIGAVFLAIAMYVLRYT